MTDQRARRSVVIGGGIAGLATAALLAREGDDVTLLEARPELGGRAGSWQRDGFRFDTGPSWYLMPEVFEHFFRLLGTTTAEQFRLDRLDPAYRVFFEDSAEPLVVRADRDANLAAFDRLEPGAGVALDRYLTSAARTYRLALDRFLYAPGTAPLRDRRLARDAVRLARLLLQPLDGFIRRFVTDSRLRRVLGFPAVFLGTSPFRAPSLYHLMSHLDLEGGVLYPQGGFAGVIASIERLAREAGVRMLTSSPAVAIETTDAGAVRAVRYRDSAGAERELPAEVVVAAGDLHDLQTRLLPARLRDRSERSWRRRVPGPSAVLALVGVRGGLPELDHHNLYFAEDWRGNFEAIFGSSSRIPDPASFYVCRPSATDPRVAPPGHENLFLLVPVPADPAIGAGGIDGAGDAAVEAVADAALRRLAERAGIPDLLERVVVRRTIGPADFEREFHAWRGTALGPAHTLRQSAFLRGSNRSSKVGGLYFAGADTVPGIGLPMCLISAELVVKHLRGDTSAQPLAEPRRSHADVPERS